MSTVKISLDSFQEDPWFLKICFHPVFETGIVTTGEPNASHWARFGDRMTQSSHNVVVIVLLVQGNPKKPKIR